MPHGKIRTLARLGMPKFQCPLCDYVARNEKQKELHFKYSHGLKYNKDSKDIGAYCDDCGKRFHECVCSHNGRRRMIR